MPTQNHSKLSKYESKLLKSVEAGQWKSVKNLHEEKNKYSKIAEHTMRAKKDKRISIRISSADLQGIKVESMHEGIPYQTLISSILHKHLVSRS